MANKRPATYISTLVYMDEPLLLKLKSYKTNLLAVAIPSAPDKAFFLATTVSSKDLENYLEGHVDLRYLFTFPSNRSDYTFDLMEMEDNRVSMELYNADPPEEWLPTARFFASSHTHDESENDGRPSGIEKLVVDGEWDMPDFGAFYSRYSDVYYLLSATHAFTDEARDLESRKIIKQTFTGTPFKGGFSYVNFYGALPSSVTRQDRLRMDKIRYESPGYVDVHGDQDTFTETQALIRSFLHNRAQLRDLYHQLHDYLSKNRYLTMSGDAFLKSDPAAPLIDQRATQIAEVLKIPNVDTLKSLVENNALVFAKIILSLYRRLKDTAQFFAQGRMNFS